jgi:Fe2+ transport system protein B
MGLHNKKLVIIGILIGVLLILCLWITEFGKGLRNIFLHFIETLIETLANQIGNDVFEQICKFKYDFIIIPILTNLVISFILLYIIN